MNWSTYEKKSYPSSSAPLTLNRDTVKQLTTIAAESNKKGKEIASALTVDGTASTAAVSIDQANSQEGQVSYTTQDLTQSIQDTPDATMEGVQFHTHIQWLNHANVHSHQDELQHSKNIEQSKKATSSEIFNCLGNGIIWVREDGWFHIKARWSDNSLMKFSYWWVIAQELVFDKKGTLIGHNIASTLDPQDNTSDSRSYQQAA